MQVYSSVLGSVQVPRNLGLAELVQVKRTMSSILVSRCEEDGFSQAVQHVGG